jgi:hypothetical protein
VRHFRNFLHRWVLFFAASLLVSSGFAMNSAWAISHLISIEAKIGSKKPVQGKVKILEGQEGIVSTKDTVIKLLPSVSAHGSLKIQIEAYRKTETGLQKVSSTNLLVHQNEPAEFSESTEDGQPLFSIKLTSKPVQ